jgi:hypothetical protein
MAEASASVMPVSTKDILLSAAVMLGLGAAGLLITWGHPWSNWYYAFILVCLVAAPFATFLGWKSGPLLPSYPPMAESRAMLSAALAFLLSASFMFFYMFLLLGEPYQWPVATGLGLTNGVNVYRAKRGMPFSKRPMRIIWGVFMAGLLVFAIVKLARKGVLHF